MNKAYKQFLRLWAKEIPKEILQDKKTKSAIKFAFNNGFLYGDYSRSVEVIKNINPFVQQNYHSKE